MRKFLKDFILFLVFITMALTTVVLVFAAYSNHRLAYHTITDAFCSIEKNLTVVVDPGKKAELPPCAALYLEQLKTAEKSAFDANTVAFLFQVLLLCMISIGAYMMERSLSAVRKAEETVNQAFKRVLCVKPFLAGVSVSQVISSLYTRIHQMSALLPSVSVEKRGGITVSIRDSFQAVENQLVEVTKQGLGIEPALYDFFMLDTATTTHRILESLRSAGEDSKASGIADLIQRSQRCLHLLESGEYKERYKEQLAGLEQRPESQ